jgi:LacI family transcriptional regulator
MDDLRRFCCLNPDCPDHGRRDHGNLSVCMRYGPKLQTRLLYCKSCRARFSERKGTPLFGGHLSHEQTLSVLAHLADGCGIRQTARLTGVSKDTVTRLARRAGDHARRLHDEVAGFSPLDHQAPTR